jgi:glutathione S-transferase
MKLYYSPGACSLSPHIALRESGLPFQLERVDLRARKTQSGADFNSISPNGYVPALELDDGEVLTEGSAIVQYIADQRPEAELAPPAGAFERYRLQEWLNFIATELHKSFSPLFRPTTPDEVKQAQRETIARRFDYISKHLEGSSYLMGETFTVADAYLFTILRWTKGVQMDLGRWPTLKTYWERVGSRPAVRAALEAERS